MHNLGSKDCRESKSCSKYRLNLKTKGSTEFITRRPWAVAPEQSEGATKGLRVINYVDHVGFEV